MAAVEGARRTVETITRAVLRWHAGASTIRLNDAAGRGWFEGVTACAQYLSRATGGELATARAFGGDWAVVRGVGWLAAPALPVVLTASGGEGPNAGYRLCDGAVWREAAGAESLFLTTNAADPIPGTPFDLLWFGDAERYSFRRGLLAVDDLFALVEMAVDRGTLERLLVRGRRVEAAVLEGLAFERPDAPTRITVNRSAELMRGGSWRDPERLLRGRADVERTTRRGNRVTVCTAAGTTADFICEEGSNGWTARVDSGDYPLTVISLCNQGTIVSLAADIHPAIDPLAPGVRGRLAFDLRSDLVVLGCDPDQKS